MHKNGLTIVPLLDHYVSYIKHKCASQFKKQKQKTNVDCNYIQKNTGNTFQKNTTGNTCPIPCVQSQFYKQAIIMPSATTCKHFLAQTLFRACARENTNVYIYVFLALFLRTRTPNRNKLSHKEKVPPLNTSKDRHTKT